MIKIICFISCFLIVTATTSQVRFGLRTGFHFSNIERGEMRTTSSSFNMHTGVQMDWTIDSSDFHLQAQVLYKPMGYAKSNILASDQDGFMLGNIDNHRINYIELPVYVLYNRSTDQVGFFGGFGPFVSFKTGDRMTLEGGEKFGNGTALPANTSEITPVLYGLGMQAGVEWNRLTLSLQFQQSFNGIYSNQANMGSGWKIHSFGISMGYFLGMK